MDLKKVIISKYDETIKFPPYRTIQVDETTVEKPEQDYLGKILYENLKNSCRVKGYRMQFYTLSQNPAFDYEVIVK